MADEPSLRAPGSWKCAGRRFDPGCLFLVADREIHAIFPGTRFQEAMGDKNPKAKRKQQAQHELHKKHKTEANRRHQQHLHELHEMKHPHETKG